MAENNLVTRPLHPFPAARVAHRGTYNIVISLSAPSRVAFALRGLLHISVMTSNHGCCGCCSRRAVIIAFAFTGVCLLAAGLVFRLSDIFNKIIKEKVDQASFV